MPTLQGHIVHASTCEQEWYTLREAAQVGFGGYSTLRKYIAEGDLVAYKIGGLIKVHRSDLDALPVPVKDRKFEDIEAAIERIVATAPPLTDDQCRRLASLLGGA